MVFRLLFTFSGLMTARLAFTIHFFDPKIVPGITALTISPILSRLAVNYTKNVWFPADF
jgi:hypothetical protein